MSVSRVASHRTLRSASRLPELYTDFLSAGATKANDVFNISLVTKSEQGPPKTLDSFQPKWTYPIYEEEEIYGYKGVKINLRFNASDMRPHFSYTKGKEVPLGLADKEPTEIKESIEGFLPNGKLAAVLGGVAEILMMNSCLCEEGRI